MKFAQRYAKAITSTNLRCDIYHRDTDQLAAAALSGQIGAPLLRVKYANDATAYASLLVKWQALVQKKSLHRRWPKHVIPHKVALASLNYWLNDVCPACSGKAYEALPKVPNVLSDTQCKACNGQGKRALVCEANWYDYIADMVEELDDMARHAAGVAMRKLRSDMDAI